MTPPPTGGHSIRQSAIILTLHELLGGQPLAECPISTIDGVKAADVGWYTDARFRSVQGQEVFEQAPEICVEVLLSSNTEAERMWAKRGCEQVEFVKIDTEGWDAKIIAGGRQLIQNAVPTLAKRSDLEQCRRSVEN